MKIFMIVPKLTFASGEAALRPKWWWRKVYTGHTSDLYVLVGFHLFIKFILWRKNYAQKKAQAK